MQTQVVYLKPPADGALPDPTGTFKVVQSPFDTAATDLQPGEVLVENLYLSIDPYHRFGLYDPAVTRSQFPVTTPGTVISTYGVSRHAWPDRLCRHHAGCQTQERRDHRRLRHNRCGWHGRVAVGESTGTARGGHGGI